MYSGDQFEEHEMDFACDVWGTRGMCTVC